MDEFTVSDFCRALLSTLVEKHGKHAIHLDDDRTVRALSEITDVVWREAKRSFDAGRTERAAMLADWLNVISPNPNTGAFDGFWQAFRNLQPLDFGVRNPRYLKLDATLDPPYRQATLGKIPAEWRKLVDDSGEILKQAA